MTQKTCELNFVCVFDCSHTEFEIRILKQLVFQGNEFMKEWNFFKHVDTECESIKRGTYPYSPWTYVFRNGIDDYTYNITIFGPHDTNAHALINVTIFSVKPSQLINVNHDFRLYSKKSTFLSHRSQKFDSSSSRSTSLKLFSKNTSRSDVSLQFGFKTGE